jgi:hypothetical protein
MSKPAERRFFCTIIKVNENNRDIKYKKKT